MEKNKEDASSVPDDEGFPFVAAFLAPPKSGGVGGFSFGSSSSSDINVVTGSVYALSFGTASSSSAATPALCWL